MLATSVYLITFRILHIMRTMDRFLFFDQDGTMRELLESPYEDVATVG